MNLLDLVFHYRQLLAKSRAALGLTWDEIDLVGQVEGLFAAPGLDGRQFRRQTVCMPATMRGDGLRDPIAISELSPGGLICHAAPYVSIGDALEIIIEIAMAHPDEPRPATTSLTFPRATSENEAAPGTQLRSYRFAAVVVWLREDADDAFTVGLAFMGIPVVVNYVAGEKFLLDQQRSAA
ncbi:MAG: hypothetical protein IPL79_02175 [Myxococcales bacterium]|nr:hypothetical protein [Myxococcales bacterium]